MAGSTAGYYFLLSATGGAPDIRYFASTPKVAGWQGPYATKGAAFQAATGSNPSHPGNSGQWWIVETFFSDGSENWAVGTAKAGLAHPVPTDNEVVWGPYPSQAAAQAAVDGHTFDQAPQSYYGKNVSKGPLGLPVPGDQAPGVPHLGVDWGQVMIRIGEALLGIVLIGIGLARITGAPNAIATIAKARIP